MDKQITCVKSFMSRIQADIAKGALEAQHISAFVQADDAGGAYPFPFANKSAGAQLFVKTSDLDKAQNILKKL